MCEKRKKKADGKCKVEMQAKIRTRIDRENFNSRSRLFIELRSFYSFWLLGKF